MPDIACALKRYDGGSGSATYTGVIPLKPGQLFETSTGLATANAWPAAPWLVAESSLRANVSLWRGVSPGVSELPAYITALYPQHPDGSIKCVMVSTILTAAVGEEVPLTLKLGTSPTLAASPTAHPTINAAWMKFPRLIGCVDQVHMCQSRVALGPLVPVNDPRLPAQWQRLLDVEFTGNSMRTGTGLGPRGPQGYASYSHVVDLLNHFGHIGSFLCRLTHGSNVVTIVDTGWPTPSSPPTAQLVIGMVLETTTFGGQPFPIAPGATITAIDANGTDFTISTPADLSCSIFNTQLGTTLPRTAGAQAEYEVTLRHFSIFLGELQSNNCIAPMYYRYMTAASGHLDKLRLAHLLAMTREHDAFCWVGRGDHHTHGIVNHGNGSAATGSSARYHGTYTDAAGVVHAHLEEFPIDEYGQPFKLSVGGNQASSSGWKESAWMCYVLSGWRQPMGALISYHLDSYLSSAGGALTYLPFRGYPWAGTGVTGIGPGSPFHTPSLSGGWDGPRVNWRLYRQGDLLLYLLSLPFSLNNNQGGHVAVTPRLAANKEKYLVYFQRKYWDSVDFWSTEPYPDGTKGAPQDPGCPHICPGAPVGTGVYPELGSQYLAGLWGFSNRYIQYGTIAQDPQYRRYNGPGPVFQTQLMFATLLQCHMHAKEDDFQRLGPKMTELALRIAHEQNYVGGVEQKQLISGNPNAPVGHGFVYGIPYRFTNPALLANPPIVPAGYSGAGSPDFLNRHPWVTGIVTPMLTWAAMVTGDAKLLAMADGHATIYSTGFFSGGNTLVPSTYGLKYLGEFWGSIHYAAAWRAGETWGIPATTATLSPPVITDAPYDAGETVVTGTGVAGGTVTLFRNGVAV